MIRNLRKTLLEQYPSLAPYLDDIIPKKQPLILVKCSGHINLLVVNKEPIFFNERDGKYYPTLRLLHKYPFILPSVQVDRGAIKFVLQGANIMCPGLTSAGGKLDTDFAADTIVCVLAEGKENALGIGLTKMSRDEIRSVNKGIAIDNIHYLNDGLWKLAVLE